jgi:hypothetical protein
MDNIKQSNDKIEFTSHLSLAARAALMIVGLFPLFAPYELLIKPSWSGEISWHMVFFLFISIMAVLLSIFFVCSALFGMNQSIQINSTTRMITHEYKAGILRFRQKQYLFTEIEMVQLKVHKWTDGPPTYNIAIRTTGQREIEFGGLATQEEAEKYVSILKEVINDKNNPEGGRE